MIYCCTNNSVSGLRKLIKKCYHSKEQNFGQKTSNLAFFFIKKRCIVGEIMIVLIDIIIVV